MIIFLFGFIGNIVFSVFFSILKLLIKKNTLFKFVGVISEQRMIDNIGECDSLFGIDNKYLPEEILHLDGHFLKLLLLAHGCL